jgi:hypothetical protein
VIFRPIWQEENCCVEEEARLTKRKLVEKVRIYGTRPQTGNGKRLFLCRQPTKRTVKMPNAPKSFAEEQSRNIQSTLLDPARSLQLTTGLLGRAKARNKLGGYSAFS